MKEHTGIITFMGGPLTLLGEEVASGQKAPDFTVLANDLSPKKLSDYKGHVLILASVPSLDTGVCSLETKRFNKEAASLGNVKVLTISCDLPFAQGRWCASEGIENVETLSDHKDLSFGLAYGVAIKELRLLARTVFVVNSKGEIVYKEIVPEVTNEPNYERVLAAARAAS